jgi:hypothetical protein
MSVAERGSFLGKVSRSLHGCETFAAYKEWFTCGWQKQGGCCLTQPAKYYLTADGHTQCTHTVTHTKLFSEHTFVEIPHGVYVPYSLQELGAISPFQIKLLVYNPPAEPTRVLRYFQTKQQANEFYNKDLAPWMKVALPSRTYTLEADDVRDTRSKREIYLVRGGSCAPPSPP